MSVADHAHAEPSQSCRSGAGGQSRDDREESHDRERKRQKEDTGVAKAEDAAAAEPKAGVILEVDLPPCSRIRLPKPVA